jgi:hypothetical protein
MPVPFCSGDWAFFLSMLVDTPSLVICLNAIKMQGQSQAALLGVKSMIKCPGFSLHPDSSALRALG